ncbi:hypothetical protein [Lacrimispora brassicae]
MKEVSPMMMCLHASRANIAVIDNALEHLPIKINHHVDEELIKMIREGEAQEKLRLRVGKQINELIAQQPDFILITCTNYIALLEDISLGSEIPILKIDEVLFKELADIQEPLKIVFTNEATIQGTMDRLQRFCQMEQEIEILLIEDVFEWYLAGDIVSHNQKVLDTLLELDAVNHTIAVAQLSLAYAAEMYNHLANKKVISPLSALEQYITQAIT